jgi:NADPH:quinone reductase-like Zn-dependent oxidoreductase
MAALTQDRYGTSEVLQLSQVPRPRIAADQVLVEVVAAGLDRGVWHLMTGKPYLVRLLGFGLTKPSNPVLGSDVAGRVVAVGDDVTRFSAGDEVFGIASGSFAQFAAADEEKLVLKPAGLSFEEAAVSAISGMTAHQALHEVGQVEAGQEVLILGASGGVGTFAVQMAKAAGATVTGVASTTKLDTVLALGADRAVDYTTTAIDEIGRRFDLIIDIGGRNKMSAIRRALTPTGTWVIVGGEGGDRLTGGMGRNLAAVLLSPFVKQRLTFFINTESLANLQPLAEQLATGAVRSSIGHRFDLAQGAEAMAALEAGSVTGKTVISVSR